MNLASSFFLLTIDLNLTWYESMIREGYVASYFFQGQVLNWRCPVYVIYLTVLMRNR